VDAVAGALVEFKDAGAELLSMHPARRRTRSWQPICLMENLRKMGAVIAATLLMRDRDIGRIENF